MKKIIIGILIIALFSSVSVVSAQTSQKLYKIGIVAWVGWSPINVAEVKGFCKEQGLNVIVVNFESIQAIQKSIDQKVIDIGFDMAGSVVGYYMDGHSRKIIGEMDWSHGGDKILVKADVSLESLKGKFIGTYSKMPAVTYFLYQYLKQHNMLLPDFRVVEMEPTPLTNLFISNRIKLIINYDPEALRAERQGNGKVVATSADYKGCIPEVLYGRADVISSIPREDLIKILKGWIQGVKWAQNPDNWKEYQQILNNYTLKGQPASSEADLKEMLGAVKIHDQNELANRNGNQEGFVSFLKELNAFLKVNNLLKRDFKPEDVFDNSFIMQALKEIK